MVCPIRSLHCGRAFVAKVIHVGIGGSETCQRRCKVLRPADTFFCQRWITPSRHDVDAVMHAPKPESRLGHWHTASNTMHMFEHYLRLLGRHPFSEIDDRLHYLVSEFTEKRAFEVIVLAGRSCKVKHRLYLGVSLLPHHVSDRWGGKLKLLANGGTCFLRPTVAQSDRRHRMSVPHEKRRIGR